MRIPNVIVGLAAAIVLSQASSAAPWAVAASLTVSLEVTQAIQDEMSSIPLVAGRRTAVRARLNITDPAGSQVASIELAELTAIPASEGLPAPKIIPPEGPNKEELLKFLRRGDKYNRGEANHTLNFRIADIAAGAWKLKVKVKVKFDSGASASAEGTASLKCVSVRPIHIYLVPMKYKAADGTTYGPPDTAKLKKAEALLRACFPLPESAVIEWKGPELMPDTERKTGGCINGILDARQPDEDDSNDVDQALEELFALKLNTERALQPETPDVYYFGWVENNGDVTFIADGSPDCHPILGWSSCGVGFGTAYEPLAGKVIAHELGHMLKLDHFTDCDGTGPRACYLEKEVGWDVEKHQPRVNCHSFMICGNEHRKHNTSGDVEAVTADNVWISLADYRHCLEAWSTESPAPPPSACETQQDPQQPRPPALLVEGFLSEGGSKIAWLKPLFPYLWPARTTASVGSGELTMEVTLSTGQVIPVMFDPRLRVEHVRFDKAKLRSEYGYFRVAVPIPTEAKTVERVIIRRGNDQLIDVTRRATPPTIESPSLDPDKPLSEKTTLTWTPKADPAIRLRYHVVYSPDGGTTFERVGVNLRKPEAIIDPAILTGSEEGKGIIRIYVSDGLNTVPVDIGKLTVRAK